MSKKNKKIVEGQIEEPQVEETTQEEIVESEPIRIDSEVFETKLFVEEIDAELEDAIEELKALPDVTEEEPVAEVPTAIAVDAIEVEPKEFHHEFQETYFIGGGDPNTQPNIDVLPEPCKCVEPCDESCICQEPAPRTIESLSREEERNFRRTGVMPK